MLKLLVNNNCIRNWYRLRTCVHNICRVTSGFKVPLTSAPLAFLLKLFVILSARAKRLTSTSLTPTTGDEGKKLKPIKQYYKTRHVFISPRKNGRRANTCLAVLVPFDCYLHFISVVIQWTKVRMCVCTPSYFPEQISFHNFSNFSHFTRSISCFGRDGNEFPSMFVQKKIEKPKMKHVKYEKAQFGKGSMLQHNERWFT